MVAGLQMDGFKCSKYLLILVSTLIFVRTRIYLFSSKFLTEMRIHTCFMDHSHTVFDVFISQLSLLSKYHFFIEFLKRNEFKHVFLLTVFTEYLEQSW